MPRTVTRVDISGPGGRLVGLWAQPEDAPAFAAVVSHPHPLFGGTMDNKVAYRVARALEDAGGTVLRYNFRGAGGSEGDHDHGIGEQDDLRAAIAHLRSNGCGRLPLLLAGFSFGSAMSARVAMTDPLVVGLLLVGAPVRTYTFEELQACEKPVAFLHGEHDEHGPLPQLEALVASLRCPTRIVIIPGAGHFFDREQGELHEAVVSTLRSGFFGEALVPKTADSSSGEPC